MGNKLETGDKLLDEALQLKKGQLTCVLGHPMTYKTALLVNTAARLLEMGKRVVFISFEESTDYVQRRIYEALRREHIPLDQKAPNLPAVKLAVASIEAYDPDRLAKSVKFFKSQYPDLDLVIVDGLCTGKFTIDLKKDIGAVFNSAVLAAVRLSARSAKTDSSVLRRYGRLVTGADTVLVHPGYKKMDRPTWEILRGKSKGAHLGVNFQQDGKRLVWAETTLVDRLGRPRRPQKH